MATSISWFHVMAILSALLVLFNVYGSLFATITPTTTIKEGCTSTSTATVTSAGNNIRRSISWRKEIKNKRTVIIFTCNAEYGQAVASSVISVRVDGGYYDDVAILMEEDTTPTAAEGRNESFTIPWMKDEILRQAREVNLSNRTTIQEKSELLNLNNIHIFSTQELFDSLLSSQSNDQQYPNSLSYLRETPPVGECSPPKRKLKHRGYYLKTLIYHPLIAEKWDIVLFMDACMTIHSPHIDEIFHNIPEVENRILALPDPWRWGQDMLQGRLLSCTNQSLLHEMEHLMDTKLREAIYFTTAFVLFDTSVIRNHNHRSIHLESMDGDMSPSSSSLIELLELYHKFGSQFPGDQPIVSIYWYHVRDVMRNLPLSLLGSNRVPYEFLKRIPKTPHIVTAGNSVRPTCLSRPKNVFGVA